MDNKLVSILIPVYNREKIIGETISSAINQTYKNIEIIIIDNCSTDNTWTVIKEFSKKDNRIRIFRNKENVGPVKNWEHCVKEARGEYGKFLWSDDLIASKFIEKTIPFLNNKNIGFVYTATEIFKDGTNDKSVHFSIGKTGIYNMNQYIHGVLFETGYPVSPGCAIFRMDDFKNHLLVNIPTKKKIDFNEYAIGND